MVFRGGWMLLEGNIKTDKSFRLAKEYLKLINQGTPSEQILVICLNSYKKQQFIDFVKENTDAPILEKLNISTFYGLCYNAIMDNWPVVEEKIIQGNSKIMPNLCGLEVSQYIFKKAISETGFKDYISKVNLLHQLFRRYSLIVQNCLEESEIKRRSSILNEVFNQDAQKAIAKYKISTLQKRSFDYLRQLSIFPYIYRNTDYFKEIKYLFVDDGDEITYILLDFIKHLKPQLKEAFIGYDEFGASRCGYLSAYKTAVFEFENLFNEKAIKLNDESLISSDAQKLFKAILNNQKATLKSVQTSDHIKKLDMVDEALNKIKKLFDEGIKPNEISIIAPAIDDTIEFALKEFFNSSVHKYQIISGSEKLFDNPIVKSILIILKLANSNWHIDVDEIELRTLFASLLKIPVKYCFKEIQAYKNAKQLLNNEFENESYTQKYQNLIQTIDKLKGDDYKDAALSTQIMFIFNNLVCKSASESDLNKISFLLKEIESFEVAFEENDEVQKRNFIIQIENTIISETPSKPAEIDPESLIVSTPQKIIDYEIKTKYQFWLDVSSRDWLKQDIGTLYNAWVFNADWDKDEFTYDDNLRLTKEKTARMLRKLMLCCDEKIYCLSSLYDSLGNENFDGINEFFAAENDEIVEKPVFKITPRTDQRAVLQYENGYMGVMAVPGAGKTTILLALIEKLLSKGIKAENIFVLTYMDSAARNFKERLKTFYPNHRETPNISTIHGLALRIIKENSNYAKLGLSENFEICDDTERQRIIRETLYKLKIEQDNFENYERAISAIKLSSSSKPPISKYKEIQNFIRFYNAYNKNLRTKDLIDYDDMLSLSVKLLEDNADILSYYQDLCQYIIEDEAQDSSVLQQKLLSMLSSKHKNLVRCGDINQSITSTFTNSDLKDFRKFLNKGQCVEMNSSQRCSKAIYSMANKLVDFALKTSPLDSAFYPIQMQETGANPASDNNPEAIIFETDDKEKEYILKELKQILATSPDSTIALLLRNNYQVIEYDNFLKNNGLKTITRTDSLGQKNVFKIIFALLKFIKTPWNNKNVATVMEVLSSTNTASFSADDFTLLKELKQPFINLKEDEIKTEELAQFMWDLNYWVNNSNLPIEDLATKIGTYYFHTDIEKSNVYLIATLIKKLSQTYKTYDNIIDKLEEMSNKPILSKYKFFSEEEITPSKGSIKIMTVHKSKGDEFDAVFIPEFTEDNYPTNINDITVKANTHFLETIKGLDSSYNKKNETELKKAQIEETLRLIYVAITRAKTALHITCSKKYKRRKKSKPSILFEHFEGKDYAN